MKLYFLHQHSHRPADGAYYQQQQSHFYIINTFPRFLLKKTKKKTEKKTKKNKGILL